LNDGGRLACALAKASGGQPPVKGDDVSRTDVAAAV
jgi:hypothetical protein